jgi:hypothetical protein
VKNGLPQGAMHSGRKVNLGRRNGLAMLGLQRKPLSPAFGAPGYNGPVAESATVTKSTNFSSDGSYNVTIAFESATNLHFAGAACCIICCKAKNGSAIQVQVANASDRTGFTWQVQRNSRHIAPFTPTFTKYCCTFSVQRCPRLPAMW